MRAAELAGRCCEAGSNLILDPDSELLAHDRGWVWAIYYTQGKTRTHVALIHSDGTPLARTLADEVIDSDHDVGGELHTLTCLNPVPSSRSDTQADVAAALAVYGKYLANECGYIQLDGLPADSDVGSRRLQLENLFVPLHLDVTDTVANETRKRERLPVGAVLTEHPRLALLAAPGGGKSTLLKRLAVAYADPARRGQVSDDLPQRDWLPLFFRCRELRDLARGSFADLLEALSRREPVRQYASDFRALVDRALLAGQVLLLVDGLDEISDPGDRAAFVCTLRAALQAYPGVALVVTSREAGFRHVAAHLAPVCTDTTLSAFNADDIRRLCVAWHREVVGDTEKVRTDAEQLAATIAGNDRIQRLAVNPLLLTTLLLVKRWVGALPTRRAVLYGKAVEVLLMTWNTEGHEPIPDDEALPQLCYVASAMMLGGVQKISRPRLAALLQEARTALPTELGYVKGTMDEFIHRVEDRSSLLMMTGYDVESGRLVEFFEFRHPTFQEYLTAHGMVEGWHPEREEKDTLASVLEPYCMMESWHEVIPLAAVLGGKETEALIHWLTTAVERIALREIDPYASLSAFPQLRALGNCLADEAAARPETIRAAIRALVRLGSTLEWAPFTSALRRGRYGEDLLDESRRAFFGTAPDLNNAGGALWESVWGQRIEPDSVAGSASMATRVVELLNAVETHEQCEGALACACLCFRFHRLYPDDLAACAGQLRSASPALVSLLLSEQLSHQYASSWALAWLGTCHIWTLPTEPDVLGRLFMLWRHSPDADVKRMACWALANQSLTPRDDGKCCISIPQAEVEYMLQRYDELRGDEERSAALVIAWYLRALDDVEIAQRARACISKKVPENVRGAGSTIRAILKQLDETP